MAFEEIPGIDPQGNLPDEVRDRLRQNLQTDAAPEGAGVAAAIGTMQETVFLNNLKASRSIFGRKWKRAGQ